MRDLIRPGDTLSRRIINSIPRETLRCVRPGPGINIIPTGDGICVGLKPQPKSKFNPGDIIRIGKVASLNPDGDQIVCYLWDYMANGWATETTDVYKPFYLQKTEWDGKTITYTDGTSKTYDATSLDITYQRRATWDGGTETEIQEITEPYGIDEKLVIIQLPDATLMDANVAGRHFAVQS